MEQSGDEDGLAETAEEICERLEDLGIDEAEVRTTAEEQIEVTLPDSGPAQALAQNPEVPRLYFYDWEPNLIGISKKVGGRPGTTPPERLTDQLEEIWARNGREPNEPLNQTLVRDGAFPNAYEAALVAAKQPPDPDCTDCADSAPRFYLFEKAGDHELIAGPLRERRSRDGTQVVEVPPGTTLVFEYPLDPTSGETIDTVEPGWFVLRDRPALSGADIADPEQAFDQFNQPVVQFDFTPDGREAFEEVTGAIAQRGAENAATQGAIGAVDPETAAAFSHHFAIVLDGEVVTRPIINFQENPEGIDGRTGAEISGGFSTPQEARDIATLLHLATAPVLLRLAQVTHE